MNNVSLTRQKYLRELEQNLLVDTPIPGFLASAWAFVSLFYFQDFPRVLLVFSFIIGFTLLYRHVKGVLLLFWAFKWLLIFIVFTLWVSTFPTLNMVLVLIAVMKVLGLSIVFTVFFASLEPITLGDSFQRLHFPLLLTRSLTLAFAFLDTITREIESVLIMLRITKGVSFKQLKLRTLKKNIESFLIPAFILSVLYSNYMVTALELRNWNGRTKRVSYVTYTWSTKACTLILLLLLGNLLLLSFPSWYPWISVIHPHE